MMPRNTVQATADAPPLQFANGKTEARGAGHSRFSGFVGFHSECGKDEDFDRQMHTLGVMRVEIRHPREGGQPVIAQHWNFGEWVRFHPITAGPPYASIVACLKGTATAEAGIGLAWPRGEKSRMAVRGFLVIEGQHVLVQLGVRSTMTGYLLAALIDHARVCEAADALIDRAKHPDVVAFHELALPLAAGPEKAVGKTETTTIAPLISSHPAEPDLAHLRSLWRSEALHSEALELWPGVVEWAHDYARAAEPVATYQDAL